MKTLCTSALSVMALGLILIYSSCGPPPPEPLVQEVQLEKLKGVWKVKSGSSSVTLEQDDKTSDYSNFTLEITGVYPGSLSYKTTGRPPLSPWPAEGTWEFSTNSPETLIIRDPANSAEALDINYIVSNADAASRSIELSFEFTKAGYESSRVKSVTGNWIFKLDL